MADVNINISRAIVTKREGQAPVVPAPGGGTVNPGGMFVQSVRGGVVDNTDPYNPIINVDPSGGGIGIILNGLVIGGVKRLIEETDLMEIPLYWEYNVSFLEVDGIIDNESIINIG